MPTTIKKALAQLTELGEKRDDPLPALTSKNISEAEKRLGCTFPESYKTFLMEAREYGLQYEEFLWVGPAKILEETNTEDIVSVTMEERREGTLPPFLISFLSDGYGTQVCFDTRRRDDSGEFLVVEWERGMEVEHLRKGQPQAVAKNFPTWLVARLKEEHGQD